MCVCDDGGDGGAKSLCFLHYIFFKFLILMAKHCFWWWIEEFSFISILCSNENPNSLWHFYTGTVYTQHTRINRAFVCTRKTKNPIFIIIIIVHIWFCLLAKFSIITKKKKTSRSHHIFGKCNVFFYFCHPKTKRECERI